MAPGDAFSTRVHVSKQIYFLAVLKRLGQSGEQQGDLKLLELFIKA